MVEKEKKRRYGFIVSGVVFILIFIGIFWWFNSVSSFDLQKQLGNIDYDGSILRVKNAGTTGDDVVDDVLEELRLLLEPMDDECIEDEGACLVGCDFAFEDCGDDVGSCYETCNDIYPYTDEIESCQDECYVTEDVCLNSCDIELLTFVDIDIDTERCYDTCYDEGDVCGVECDGEYYGCLDDCDSEVGEVCIDGVAECYYNCVFDCIPEDETTIWDGSEVTNVGEFYEVNFPRFSGQVSTMCDTIMFGNYVSQEDKFGCVDLEAFGFWMMGLMRSIESAEVVCETIDGEWNFAEGDVSCNMG